MIWALRLLGFGKTVLSWVRSGLKWIFASIERVIIAALLAVCVVLFIGKASEARRADKWAVAAQKWRGAYDAMVTANQLATDAANANVKRVEAEYKEIADEAEKDLANELAANRAALDRFVRRSRQGATGQADSPTGPEMPTDPLREAEEAVIPVRIEDLQIAADNYSQLVALIEWATNIGEVETVPTPE